MSVSEASLAERNRELGGVISPERAQATTALYEPLLATAPFGDVEVVRDERYGRDERHRLDLFVGTEARLAQGAPGVPVVAFVHGGNFVGGDKHVGDGPFYDNVGVWAARAGYLGATLTYRLAPAAGWPAGREDVAQALAWLRANCARWGGDPERIVLIGASAGATHVASAVARDASDTSAQRPAGVALLSGMYDLVAFGNRDVLTPYYGADPRVWMHATPVEGLCVSGVPVLLAIAEYDPPAQHRQMPLLIDALLARDGRMPHVVYLPGHNHFSEVLHIGTDDHLLTDQLSSFIATCTGGGQAGGDDA